jgi:hypothetical protein
MKNQRGKKKVKNKTIIQEIIDEQRWQQ